MGWEEVRKGSSWLLSDEHHGRPPPESSQDLTPRDGAEREVAAHVAVAEALAAWEETESGFARLLEDLAQSLDCEMGVLWVPRGDRLKPRVYSHGAAGGLDEFKLMTLTSRLGRGAELPGRVWQSHEPSGQSYADGSGSPRWRAAAAAGFPGAVALPAMWANELLAVIELGSHKEPVLSEWLKRSLAAIGSVIGHFFAHRRGALDERLMTARQVQVLGLAARGLSGPQIAERLAVSPKTVKTHFEHSYARLGVNSRAAAVAEAIRLGLVD